MFTVHPLNTINYLSPDQYFMKPVYTLILLLLACTASARPDTVYYNKNWKPCAKKKAAFFEPMPVVADGHYKITDYYISGRVQMEGYYILNDIVLNATNPVDSFRDGYFKYYLANGNMEEEGAYKAGRKEGKWKEYDAASGKLKSEASYKNGVIRGECKFFYASGKMGLYAIIEDNVIMSAIRFDSTGTEIGNLNPDILPTPKVNIADYFAANLRYPPDARANNIEGVVEVSFVVDEKGKICQPKVHKGIGGGCDQEALRVVRAMPRWNPGKYDGKPAKVYYTQAVVFRLAH